MVIYTREEMEAFTWNNLIKLKRRIELLLENTSPLRDKYFQAYHEVRTELKRRKEQNDQ